MKHFVITGLFLLISLLGFSQHEFDNWYFGYHVGITFKNGYPENLPPNSIASSGSATVTVSDSTGQVLFYSSGYNVRDRTNSVMPNGFGLSGTGGGVQVISVQDLTESNKHYLFTVSIHPTVGYPLVGIRYSVIDMNLHGGDGDIIPGQKDIPLPFGDSAWMQLYGTRHQNNKYAWIVTLRHGNPNQYLAYLVDSSGFNTTPVISNSTLLNYTVSPICQFLKISPDGRYLVCSDSLMEVCDFDIATGIVTPKFKCPPGIQNPYQMASFGKEFSIDSHFLYVMGTDSSSAPGESLFQYDMEQPDSSSFMQSQVKICDSLNTSVQMAPDGKIYLTRHSGFPGFQNVLDVINNPSVKGVGCNYQSPAIVLNNVHACSLPQFIQRYKAYIHHTKECSYDSVHFSGDIWPPPDSIHWNFGDPASGTSNYSNLASPSHFFSGPGNYTVEMWVRHIDKRTDTSWVVVNVLPSPHPVLGVDKTICAGDSVTFDAGSCAGCTYLWKNLLTGLPVGTTQTFTTGIPGLYEVAVTDTNDCIGRDTVQLSITTIPVVTNTPPFKTICTGDSTHIVLTSNAPGANFYWTALLTAGNVTGFSADSGLVINQVLINHNPTSGVVTYHITPKVGSCIGTPADYAITVNPGDSVKISITASANNVCAGTPITFIASPTNGGTNPSYQWKVNGTDAGTNSPVFTYTPANGDQVSCILTSSNNSCTANNPATSNLITMVVNPNLAVSVSVVASQNPVCAGTPVTFTATPTNGGTSPQYQWKVNGVNAGTNNPVYSYIPLNGDSVRCVLTSSESCTSWNPVSSSQLLMVVNSVLQVGIIISVSANPVCTGIPVTFTATPTNGGTSPQYQWKVNGINVGTNNPVFIYIPSNGDSVRCVLTSSESCTSGNPVSSNQISMSIANAPVVTFTRCFDSITTINAKPIKLKGGIPLGGTYSGPGVNNGYFYPNLAGAGTKTITYTYTNAALCSAQSTVTIVTRNASPVTCGNNLIDIRDNKVYPTIQIGSQCWMASNLNYGNRVPGAGHQRDNCVPEKYCYNDLTANCELGTANYQWDELMQYDDTPGLKGLCPPGWHVPAEAEWNTLFANWTNNAFAGAALKYSGYSGFNALLSGVRHKNVQWDYQNFATFFWSSTPYGNYKAWAHGMNDYDPSVSLYPSSRANAFSVRCLKDF